MNEIFKNTTRTLLMVFLVLAFNLAEAQYSRPYRITFDPSSKSYLITNRGNGTIVRIDSFYKTSTVITGLTDPKDLAIGSFAGTSGLLVIDNNQIVIYEASSFQKLISYSVTGASNLEDIEIDQGNPGYFYLSDAGNNRILKGKVGPPPFYTPTYKVLSTNKINRPKGMLYDSKGRLLVVSDTANSSVIKVDTSTGVITSLFKPGLDSLNHMVEDGQGNFYFTSWGDSYLYRTSSSFDTLVKLTGYSKPAGMYVNPGTDLMILACFQCNKLDFHRLHLAEPKSDMYTCFRDSFGVITDIQANGIGTYGKNNRFVLEMSDSLGKFSKSVQLVSLPAIYKPSVIYGYLPAGTYGSQHLYRIRSTDPAISSQAMKWFVQHTPEAEKLVSDSLFVCRNSTIRMSDQSDDRFSYRWRGAGLLDDTTKLGATFSASDSGTFQYRLVIENIAFGCSDSTNVVVQVTPSIRLNPWLREMETCAGDALMLGNGNASLQYTWSPSAQLSDTTSATPIFASRSSAKYLITVRDTSSGCTGHDSLNITVHNRPSILTSPSNVAVCTEDTLQLSVTANRGVLKWRPATGISDTIGFDLYFVHTDPGIYPFQLSLTDSNQCSSDTAFAVTNHKLPEYLDFQVKKLMVGPPSTVRLSIDTDSVNIVRIYWDKDLDSVFRLLGTLPQRHDTIFELESHLDKHSFYAVIANPNNCEITTEIRSLSLVNVASAATQVPRVYPNPFTDILRIEHPDALIFNIEITDLQGVEILSEWKTEPNDVMELKLPHLKSGQYFMKVETDQGVFYRNLIKL